MFITKGAVTSLLQLRDMVPQMHLCKTTINEREHCYSNKNNNNNLYFRQWSIWIKKKIYIYIYNKILIKGKNKNK